MTDYNKLAVELKSTLEQYLPKRVSLKIVNQKQYPSQSKENNRLRYLKFKGKQPKTTARERYGKVMSSALFSAISIELGISESAARMRYYRGQVDESLLERIRYE